MTEVLTFAGHQPATFRGLTGWNEQRTCIGVAFSTFNGEYHQFALSDLDLRRLAQAASLAFPHVQFGPHLSGTCDHSDNDAGSLEAADIAVGASAAQQPDRKADSASSGVAP